MHAIQYEVVDWYEEKEIAERVWYKKKMNVWDELTLHRLEGPAIEKANGDVEYWLDGVRHTKESWEKNRKEILHLIHEGLVNQ